MSDLVCLHEPDGRYLYISPSCRRLLGYEPEDLLGTDPYDLFHPDDLERIRTEAHDKALEGQAAVSVTYRIRKKSGEYTWFETLTEPILDEGGQVVRLQTSSRDVSERKRVERVLADAARAKAEFLAEVSHELRTPLTVIRGNAEIGLEFDRDCEHEELLREIVRESSTMSRMVEDLLFLARSESAAPPFRMEPVETSVLVKRPRTQGKISGRGTRRDPRHHARADRPSQGRPRAGGTGGSRPRRQRYKVRPGRPEDNPEVQLLQAASCASKSETRVPAYPRRSYRTSSSASTGWTVPRSRVAASASP